MRGAAGHPDVALAAGDPCPRSPGFAAIVDAATRELLAIRATGGASGPPPSADKQASPAGLPAGLLWRLTADREQRRAAFTAVAALGWAGDVHVRVLAASCEDSDVCSMALLADARAAGIVPGRIVLEISETEAVRDPDLLARATGLWRAMGFRTATRHFGGGLSGLALMLLLEPAVVCLDGDWIRRVAIDGGTRIIVAGLVNTCRELGCEIIADGVISDRLSLVLVDLGVRCQSGPLFSLPAGLSR